MAKITFTYKNTTKDIDFLDDIVPDIIEGFAILGGYQEQIEQVQRDAQGGIIATEMIENPETKAQFFFKNFRNVIANELRRCHQAKAQADLEKTMQESYVAPTITAE